MAAVKVNSFVSNFLTLWADISLTLSAKNGKARMNRELDIGEFEVPPMHLSPTLDAVKYPNPIYGKARRLKERNTIEILDTAEEAVCDIEFFTTPTEDVLYINPDKTDDLYDIEVDVENDTAVDITVTGTNEADKVKNNPTEEVDDTVKNDSNNIDIDTASNEELQKPSDISRTEKVKPLITENVIVPDIKMKS